ncbi:MULTISPECIES: DUF2656 domain-containing protein [unclassified Chamaesiphon]|uniref:DUF2656 domain-containing protein n=1 Tax=unclassified Chamaesiphon TaxID=2620921 RepID=UPI00286B3B75|nr:MULTISPECIES: DUF2656 domain-containing protein [unclassified Chamaesiphon]
MNSPQTLRMLLSHNFDIMDPNVPVLSREAFTQIFVEGFTDRPEVQCRQINNPHWILEVVAPANASPQQLGEKCAQILAQSRSQSIGKLDFDILILGGIKTTPATSNNPDALQPNQWGVDVVETKSGAHFLQSIDWDGTISGKSADSIFKAEAIGG